MTDDVHACDNASRDWRGNISSTEETVMSDGPSEDNMSETEEVTVEELSCVWKDAGIPNKDIIKQTQPISPVNLTKIGFNGIFLSIIH